MLYQNTVAALVQKRQRFIEKTDREGYNELFRLMSPVATRYWTRPGSPPELAFRAGFPEYQHVFDMRSRRIIVKGRFQGGGIGYIFADELPLFIPVYEKKKSQLSFKELELLEILETEGPMSIDMMKDLTGWLSKEISPELHKLQQKFLVFEDQVDDEWDRAWYPFEAEFPDVNRNRFSREEAIQTLIIRFAYLNVFIDAAMLRSFYRLPPADISNNLNELVTEGKLKEVTIGQTEGFVRAEDIPFLEKEEEPEKSVFVLHRNDFLVKSHEHRLKKQYSHDTFSVIQYILIDGIFRGYTAGYFKNGPFVIEDIILDLDENEALERKEEIIEAVYAVNDPKLSPVHRYTGKKL